jgi:site-specific DNA-cytosine methylase
MKHKKLYVADFFAGCGGLSFGLELAVITLISSVTFASVPLPCKSKSCTPF